MEIKQNSTAHQQPELFNDQMFLLILGSLNKSGKEFSIAFERKLHL